MHRFAYILLILTLFLTNCSQAKPTAIPIYNDSIKPKLRWNGECQNQQIIKEFQSLFFSATEYQLELTEQVKENETVICLKLNGKNPNQFRIYRSNNEIQIEGSNLEVLRTGIHHFFLNYVSYYPFEKREIKKKEIMVPQQLDYRQEISFEYREPYFKQNYQAELRNFNQTNQLEETWGIWGHQIVKLTSKSPDLFAEINRKRTNEQLCFSSKLLEKEIVKIIKDKNKENNNLLKFMLMPADNHLVCQCKACVSNGNSKSNASPAVFKLVNKLAKEFPNFQIFSSAYITTDKAPTFKLEKNTGVMLSTMSFPKGILYNNSKQKIQIEKQINDWKSTTNTIYIWDYAIHFDLYLSSYPSLLIHQQNLMFLRDKGVTGIFMQGNEESYAAFEDLKYFVYAQLLLNPDADVRLLIRFYLESQYPKAGKILADYYLEIEERSLNSNHEMDIYGGWNQQINKYLSYLPLQQLIQDLEAVELKSSSTERINLKTLKLALNYQLLEIMRMNGFGNKGYASFNSNGEVLLNQEATQAFEKIQNLKKETGIEFINERHLLLSSYIDLWNSEAFKSELKTPIVNLKLFAKSKLDEDYSDLDLLINGKKGFYDYDNNWLITTLEPLNIEIEGKVINESKDFSVSFLQDTKHRIYFPKKIILTIGQEIYTVEIPLDLLRKPLSKHTIEIPLKKFKSTDLIRFEIIKQADFKNKSNACGELQFNKR
jgi:hypothetical protein